MIDPIISLLIALLVAAGAWKIIKETYIILMEGDHRKDQLEEVASATTVPRIIDIHDLIYGV